MFKKDFLWGAATSAYQIEGASSADGKGVSVWDTMCRKPGAIWKGHTGDIACDHYRRFKDDVAMMREIGLKSYRFSINWTRILPDGIGKVNEKGLQFYSDLVDELIANGIEPFVTLFHWDYPQALFEKGGWLNPESPEWFAEFATVLTQKLSDRVKYWITLNETQSFLGLGHMAGTHAPGLKLQVGEFLLASHHALLAHGRAVQAIREHSKQLAVIGYAPVGVVKTPFKETPENIEAARKATFAVPKRNWENSSWWMDPVYLGHYPEDGLELFGKDVPAYTDSEMKIISEPLDCFCVNIYNGRESLVSEDGTIKPAPRDVGFPRNAMGWGVTPACMYWGAKFFYERYKLPIYVTENGMCNVDWESLDGKVHDPQRIDFVHRYLQNLKKAAAEGVEMAGYFYWSLMDNFEWADGHSRRFGLIYVDYTTQKRIVKDSGYWYRDVIECNGENL